MTICPRAIGRNHIGEATTHFVDHHEHKVVDALEISHDWISCMLIVKLIRVDLFEHIGTDSWVVSVAHDFAAEKEADQRVGEANTDCVDKNIAGSELQCLRTDAIIG